MMQYRVNKHSFASGWEKFPFSMIRRDVNGEWEFLKSFPSIQLAQEYMNKIGGFIVKTSEIMPV